MRTWTFRIRASIYFCISISKFNCNIPFQFILKFNSVNTRNCFYKSRFAVSYMSNCTFKKLKVKIFWCNKTKNIGF